MPRTKRPAPRRPKLGHARPDQKDLTIATVKRYHALGKEAVAAAPEGFRSDGPTIKRLAEREKVSTSIIRQARIFARLYDTEVKLKTFLDLRSPNDMPLSWKHAQQLLQIEHEAERTALQSRGAQEGWSGNQLRAEVLRRVKGKDTPSAKRRKGGRRFPKSKSPQTALAKLVALSRPWLKYYEDLGGASAQSILLTIAEATPEEHDTEFLEQVREAKDVLKRVERAARKMASWLQKAESKAQPHQTGEAKGFRGKRTKSMKGPKNRPAR